MIPFEPTAGAVSQSPKSSSSLRPEETPEERPRRRRGFAAMDPKRVSEIASKGGKAAHQAGTAHEFTSDEARNAGKKGGLAPHVRRGAAPKTAR